MENQTILTVIALLLWQCVSMAAPLPPTYGVYILRISSLSIAAGLLEQMSLSFAPGLLEILQSATPPAVTFFKSLPTLATLLDGTWWAVYAIVLEKAGHRTIIYIGSGTNSDKGVYKRFREYDRQPKLPRYVDLALRNGFQITYKGLLCWTPRPRKLQEFMYRMMLLALEATFCFIFWAVKCETEYGFSMATFCPWPRDSFEYDGACSHSSLNEVPRGDPDLSPEEAEEKELREEQKRKTYYADYNADYYQANKADILAHAADYYQANKPKILKQQAEYVQANKASVAERQAAYRENNKDKLSEQHADYYQANKASISERHAEYRENNKETLNAYIAESKRKNKAAKRFHCATCDYSGRNNSELEGHRLTSAHMKAIGLDEAAIKAAIEKAQKHRCKPCSVGFVRSHGLTQHLKTKKHKEEMEKRNKAHS